MFTTCNTIHDMGEKHTGCVVSTDKLLMLYETLWLVRSKFLNNTPHNLLYTPSRVSPHARLIVSWDLQCCQLRAQQLHWHEVSCPIRQSLPQHLLWALQQHKHTHHTNVSTDTPPPHQHISVAPAQGRAGKHTCSSPLYPPC